MIKVNTHPVQLYVPDDIHSFFDERRFPRGWIGRFVIPLLAELKSDLEAKDSPPAYDLDTPKMLEEWGKSKLKKLKPKKDNGKPH